MVGVITRRGEYLAALDNIVFLKIEYFDPNSNPSNPLSWGFKSTLMGALPTRTGSDGIDFSLG